MRDFAKTGNTPEPLALVDEKCKTMEFVVTRIASGNNLVVKKR
jgi:hypothetical protein